MSNGLKISVAVLAGGASSRMGRDKAVEMLGEKTVIQHVIDALRPLSDDLFIVGGRAAWLRNSGLPHCADQYDFRASIVGVYSALAAARHDQCLVVSCDMPFISPRLVGKMAALAGDFDAVVPTSETGMEPLCAIYAKSCLEPLRQAIDGGKLALRDVLAGLNVRLVGPNELAAVGDPAEAFFNVNTPEDLKKAEAILPEVQRRRQAEQGLMERQGPPLVCFVGKKNSGKTTFLEKLVPLLSAKGLRVAFIKHDAHGFNMDHEGTDTWRISRAGARDVMIHAPGSLAVLKRTDVELTLNELVKQVNGAADIVLAEGFKRSRADRIEISRSQRSNELACREEDLIAVISDRTDAAASVPLFGMEDFEGVAGFLLERYSLGAPRDTTCRGVSSK